MTTNPDGAPPGLASSIPAPGPSRVPERLIQRHREIAAEAKARKLAHSRKLDADRCRRKRLRRKAAALATLGTKAAPQSPASAP